MESRSSGSSSRKRSRRRSRSSSHPIRSSNHDKKGQYAQAENLRSPCESDSPPSQQSQQKIKNPRKKGENSPDNGDRRSRNGNNNTWSSGTPNEKVLGVGVIFDPYSGSVSEKALPPPPPTRAYQHSATNPMRRPAAGAEILPGASAIPGINDTRFDRSLEDIEASSTPQNHSIISPPPLLSSCHNGSFEGSLDPSDLVTAMLVAQPYPSNGNNCVACNTDVEQGSSSTMLTAESQALVQAELFLQRGGDSNNSCFLSERQEQELQLSDLWANTKLRNILFVVGGLAFGAVLMQVAELMIMSKR